MAAFEIRELTPESVSDMIKVLLNIQPDMDISAVKFKSEAHIHVYIPGERLVSQITPHYMEAFLELQRQLYQLAALVETGVANAGQLTELQREQLEIAVKVSGGSSEYVAALAEKLECLAKGLIKKMNGKQAVIVVLGIAVLIASPWAFSAWLEAEKELKLAELRTKEHVTALEKLSYATEQQVSAQKLVLEALSKQGDFGERVIKLAEATNQALLKAAAKTDLSQINGASIAGSDAEALRQSARKQAETHLAVQQVTVTSIAVAGQTDEFVFQLSAPDEQHKITLPQTLFSSDDRAKLYNALLTRASIWVEISIKTIDGQIRSVEFLRVTEPPKPIARDQ